jgi:hypothetical protein
MQECKIKNKDSERLFQNNQQMPFTFSRNHSQFLRYEAGRTDRLIKTLNCTLLSTHR